MVLSYPVARMRIVIFRVSYSLLISLSLNVKIEYVDLYDKYIKFHTSV